CDPGATLCDRQTVQGVGPMTTSQARDEHPEPPARVVAAVFDRTEAGEAAMRELQAQGWTADRLGAVYRGPSPRPVILSVEDTRALEYRLRGAAVGLALGAATVAVPGIGPLMAVGMALAGAAKGSLVGSFIGLGINKQDAEDYLQAVADGGFF